MAASLLTYEDRHSPGVIKLRKHLEAELATLRRHNDKQRNETETAWTRGEIARVKATILLCVEPKKEAPAE